MKNTTLGSEDVSMESPHKALGKLLAQKASEDALRDEEEGQCNLTSFQELQILLSSRDEVSSFLEFQYFWADFISFSANNNSPGEVSFALKIVG